MKSGKTRNIQLRSIEPYNYARVVAEGYAERIRPKTAKALLIPVPTAPTDESYIESNGQFFVVRKSSGSIKANPYHDRAAKRLEGEAVAITEAVPIVIWGSGMGLSIVPVAWPVPIVAPPVGAERVTVKVLATKYCDSGWEK